MNASINRTIPRAGRGAMLAIAVLTCWLTLMTGCERAPDGLLQGYVEGEFVYVASPLAGKLVRLHVERGAAVKAADPLFALEAIIEEASRDAARHRLEQARAMLADARKGLRPTELESLEARLQQAREAVSLSAKELSRQERLGEKDVVAVESVDRARTAHTQNLERVTQLEADIKTARLGLREDAVTALEWDVRAKEAALAAAEWDLSQKRQSAPRAGQVEDTLYREGEWVTAGRPVVSLLPPANIKVRVFVPETRVAAVRAGDPATVRVDGIAEPLVGRVSFVASQAEYTPPVLYSRENRSKLVFMVELRFDDTVAARLHPGQPVDVAFAP